jgi:hypothetical protein
MNSSCSKKLATSSNATSKGYGQLEDYPEGYSYYWPRKDLVP